MIVHRDGQNLFGCILLDHVLVEHGLDLPGGDQVVKLGGVLVVFLFDNLAAELDALVANINGGAGDQLFDLLLIFTAERAKEVIVGIFFFFAIA
jgi:hypothetical protein